MKNTYIAIMAGGIGSRFWPYSRVEKPKQFLDVLNVGKTLIQLTYERFLSICPKENIFIVTNEEYTDLVKEQLPDLDEHQILKEPIRRNTAPCIAYVSHKIAARDKHATIVVAPSDHIVAKEKEFGHVIEQATQFVHDKDVLLTIGIRPSRPDTGYGYIQHEEEIIEKGVHRVKTFTEKPTLDLAKTFIDSGDFLWNSGIFIWRAESIMHAVDEYIPETGDAIRQASAHFYTEEENKAIKKAYSLCNNISIDYGVMEKATNVFVIPADFGWSDVGTWTALYDLYKKDYLGNAVSGNRVQVFEGNDNMVVASDKKLVVINGVDNCCIIDTDDVLLITTKDKEQEIKQITNDLKVKKLDQYL